MMKSRITWICDSAFLCLKQSAGGIKSCFYVIFASAMFLCFLVPKSSAITCTGVPTRTPGTVPASDSTLTSLRTLSTQRVPSLPFVEHPASGPTGTFGHRRYTFTGGGTTCSLLLKAQIGAAAPRC